MCFGASYSMRNKLFNLLLVARHILTTGLKNAFKAGSAKFSNSLSPPSIAKKVFTEVKAAKEFKQCQAKVKGVNNPAWPSNTRKLTWGPVLTAVVTPALVKPMAMLSYFPLIPAPLPFTDKQMYSLSHSPGSSGQNSRSSITFLVEDHI